VEFVDLGDCENNQTFHTDSSRADAADLEGVCRGASADIADPGMGQSTESWNEYQLCHEVGSTSWRNEFHAERGDESDSSCYQSNYGIPLLPRRGQNAGRIGIRAIEYHRSNQLSSGTIAAQGDDEHNQQRELGISKVRCVDPSGNYQFHSIRYRDES